MIRHWGILLVLMLIGSQLGAQEVTNISPLETETTEPVADVTSSANFLTANSFDPTLALVEFTATELVQISNLTLSKRTPAQDPSNRYANQPNAAILGKNLFFDLRLSSDNKASCATCHNPQQGWSTPDPRITLRGVTLTRHTPSLWNTGHQRWQFWDGRADSLWLQALESMENEAEMRGDRVTAVRLILSDPALLATYRLVFGELPAELSLATLPLRAKPRPINEPLVAAEDSVYRAWTQLPATVRQSVNQVAINLMKAIAAFEMTIESPATRFDQFVDQLITDQGHITPDNNFISAEEQQGLKLFVGKAQCIQCHFGFNLSDGEFHRIFFENKTTDMGRASGIVQVLKNPFNSSSPYADHHSSEPNRMQLLNAVSTVPFRAAFKTPTLRNLTTSAPYMHDGRFSTLEAVIKHYNEIQPRGHHAEEVLKPLGLTTQEQQYLVKFLQTLSAQP